MPISLLTYKRFFGIIKIYEITNSNLRYTTVRRIIYGGMKCLISLSMKRA